MHDSEQSEQLDEIDSDSLQCVLPLYYKRLFPYAPFFRWLKYGDTVNILNREFSFTLDGDIYIRYITITSMEDLMQRLQKDNPVKIDIGAMYTSPVSKRARSEPMTPVAKELVFDIDMTDYDEVRTCCKGADICTKCWKFMSLACKILDAALREDFGFEHILWVFSGRRGVHCWVCDSSARKLEASSRRAITEYLSLIGKLYATKRVDLTNVQMHSSVLRALDIIEEYFEEICLVDQDILQDSRIDQFITSIGGTHKFLKAEIREVIMKHNTSKERWDAFEQHINHMKALGTLPKDQQNLVYEMKIQYTYPRLDINVSTGLNHLLKSPFSIHPKTGKICIPFNVKTVDKFNPLTVPHISLLIKEINEFDAKTEEQEVDLDASVRKVKDYKKTSMYKGIMVFEQFVRKLESQHKSESGEPMDL